MVLDSLCNYGIGTSDTPQNSSANRLGLCAMGVKATSD